MFVFFNTQYPNNLEIKIPSLTLYVPLEVAVYLLLFDDAYVKKEYFEYDLIIRHIILLTRSYGLVGKSTWTVSKEARVQIPLRSNFYMLL